MVEHQCLLILLISAYISAIANFPPLSLLLFAADTYITYAVEIFSS